MTRLRWWLGGALVLASLATAVRALGAYLGHGLWLGCASVLLLAVIAVGGYLSLWSARRRIERELAGLAAEPPRGELVERRRSRLAALQARGVRPDRDALAAASEAEERGRAYLGRYFVAVTVLVGLVGTFAGLMETLRGIGPLVSDGSTLQLLRAPLAGLDVTFGASVVGILVTLALALVQGDLALAEELALARLEERTTHLLVPELWPPAQAPDERAARELGALRRDVERLGEHAGERAAAQLAEVARATLEALLAELGRGVAALQAATEKSARANLDALAQATRASVDALTQATRASAEALATAAQGHATAIAKFTQTQADAVAQATRAGAEALGAATERNVDALGAASERSVEAISAASERNVEAISAASERNLAALTAATERNLEALAAASERHGGAVADSTRASVDAMTGLAKAHLDGLAESRQATEAALATAIGDAGARLDAAAQALAHGFEGLRGVADALSPELARLGPELGALAREVSLLAARSDAGDDPLIADELVRLGEGVERLETLLKLSQA